MEIQKIKLTEEERKLVSVFMEEYYPEEVDFNWLMPVVEKIEKLDDCVFSFFIVQTECDIAFSCKYDDAPNFAQKKGDKLISTWQAVVEFINWYKTQKHPNERR